MKKAEYRMKKHFIDGIHWILFLHSTFCILL